jgi:hypothetical protein
MSKPRPRPETIRIRALALTFAAGAILFFTLSVSSMRKTSATFDEPVYIVGGLSYLTFHDFTMKDDAPPLVPYLAGIRARANGLRLPGARLPFTDSYNKEYPYAQAALYAPGSPADRIVNASRLAVLIPFGLLLLATVLLWSYELWGLPGAGLSLLLTALCPNLIAHGGVVSADLPCATTMLFASFLLRRLTRAPSTRRAIAAGLGLGLALVTKFTALGLVPCVLVVLAFDAYRRGGPPTERLALLGRHLLLVVVPAAVLVCMIYGLPPRPDLYIRNYHNLYRNVKGLEYSWYLFGQFHKTRLPYYYPAVLVVKTSVPLLLLGLGSLALLRKRSAGGVGELALFLPVLVLLLASTQDVISAGIRRVLPVLPVLAVSAGRWAPVLWDKGRRRLLLAVPLVWLAGSTIASWPHYISYFNEAAGGWRNGARLLDDSNLDWGQDLATLPDALRRAGMQDVHLFYFGQADPKWYRIPSLPASLQQIARREPGNYAISQHYVIRMREVGVVWPSREKPIGRAGTSILLYRIDR